MTTVSGPSSGGSSASAVSTSYSLTVKRTTSTGPIVRGSSVASTRDRCRSPFGLSIRSPLVRSAFRCAPRATNATSFFPGLAAWSRPRKYPPTPPAPTTAIRMGRHCRLCACIEEDRCEPIRSGRRDGVRAGRAVERDGGRSAVAVQTAVEPARPAEGREAGGNRSDDARLHAGDAALFQFAHVRLDDVGNEADVHKAADHLLVLLGCEQHEPGLGARDAELDPALIARERGVGDDAQSQFLRVELECAILIG